jgi:hypothetical protein
VVLLPVCILSMLVACDNGQCAKRALLTVQLASITGWY